MQTIGVVGGGQLCRMMGEVAKKKELPYRLIALDPTPDCPARSFIEEQIVGDYKDAAKISELASKSDIITYEIELANGEVLAALRTSGKPVHPSPESLKIIQDKFAQKTFLKSKGIPVPEFVEIADEASLRAAIAAYQYPAMLKSRRDSYDGRGNYLIKAEADIPLALDLFKGKSLMLEKYVPFEKEVSVIAARSTSGDIKTYKVGENIHQDNILHTTIAPARVSSDISDKAQVLAAETLTALQGAGVFGIEMFVVNNEVLINEIAPRVHNSGHYTIEACRTSQFEQHLRAISGAPLGDTTQLYAAVMINLLGESGWSGIYRPEGLESLAVLKNVGVHLYGKKESKPQRKMGHITVTGVNAPERLEALLAHAESLRHGLRLAKA